MHNCQGSISSNTLIDGGKASEAAAAVFLGGSGTEVIGNSLITSSTTGVTGKSAYGITVNGSTSIIEKKHTGEFQREGCLLYFCALFISAANSIQLY
jgi:hypothetical protein